MSKEWTLEQLKQDYQKIQSKYNLPSFERLNEDFHIEKISDNETDFLLREIRITIADKFLTYLRLIESIINPSNSPMFVLAITKFLTAKDRENLVELYKKISKLEFDLIELDLEYSDKKEADAIRYYCELWKEVKQKMSEIISLINKNWDTKPEDNGKGYFG